MTFYRDVIGLKVRIEGDGYVEFEMDNTKFSLFERSKLPELIGREAGKAPCGEIGFIVDDVDAEAERLKGLGVEILTGPMDRPWGERTVHISDPDGQHYRVRAEAAVTSCGAFSRTLVIKATDCRWSYHFRRPQDDVGSRRRLAHLTGPV
jgi:lactoylglutathione lyase